MKVTNSLRLGTRGNERTSRRERNRQRSHGDRIGSRLCRGLSVTPGLRAPRRGSQTAETMASNHATIETPCRAAHRLLPAFIAPHPPAVGCSGWCGVTPSPAPALPPDARLYCRAAQGQTSMLVSHAGPRPLATAMNAAPPATPRLEENPEKRIEASLRALPRSGLRTMPWRASRTPWRRRPADERDRGPERGPLGLSHCWSCGHFHVEPPSVLLVAASGAPVPRVLRQALRAGLSTSAATARLFRRRAALHCREARRGIGGGGYRWQ